MKFCHVCFKGTESEGIRVCLDCWVKGNVKVICQDCGKKFKPKNQETPTCGCLPTHCYRCGLIAEKGAGLMCIKCKEKKTQTCITCDVPCPFEHYCDKHKVFSVDGSQWLTLFENLIQKDNNRITLPKRLREWLNRDDVAVYTNDRKVCELCDMAKTACVYNNNARICNYCNTQKYVFRKIQKIVK